MVEWHEKLKKQAADKGMSGASLARRIGQHERRVNHYLNGVRQPDYGTLVKLCRVLDLSPDDVLDVNLPLTTVTKSLPSRGNEGGPRVPMGEQWYDSIIGRLHTLERDVEKLQGQLADLEAKRSTEGSPQSPAGKVRKS